MHHNSQTREALNYYSIFLYKREFIHLPDQRHIGNSLSASHLHKQ